MEWVMYGSKLEEVWMYSTRYAKSHPLHYQNPVSLRSKMLSRSGYSNIANNPSKYFFSVQKSWDSWFQKSVSKEEYFSQVSKSRYCCNES